MDGPVLEVRNEGEPVVVEGLGQTVDHINVKVNEVQFSISNRSILLFC